MGIQLEPSVRLPSHCKGASLVESASFTRVAGRKETPWSFITRMSTLLFLAGFSLYVSSASQLQATQPSQGQSPKSQAESEEKKPAPIKVPDSYRIGIGDQLQVSVWHEHDLSLQVAVRPDGNITMPLLNDIYVVGQTPKELAALITEKLKPFVNEPQVTISVSSIQSRKVYLIGQVTRQGVFSLNERKTALELITEAGGLGPFAKSNSIYVLRVVDGKETRIPFHYKKVVDGREADVELLPGDKVVVP
jgi:polysaccharide export outer membrane protein